MLFRLKRTLFIGSTCAMAGLFITSCGQSEEIADTKDVRNPRTILNSDKSGQGGETVEISIEKYAFLGSKGVVFQKISCFSPIRDFNLPHYRNDCY